MRRTQTGRWPGKISEKRCRTEGIKGVGCVNRGLPCPLTPPYEGVVVIMDALLQSITAEQIRSDIPEFGAGDTVRVHFQVVEGQKQRVQIFEGVIIQRRGDGIQQTFTVRKISSAGVGVERVFPLHSPGSHRLR